MNPIKRAAAGAALVGATLAGGAIGATLVGSAGAQTTTTTPASTSQTAPSQTAPSQTAPNQAPSGNGAPSGQQPDPSKGGHVANGITETVLTGDTATKVSDAAKAAVPGGTIIRVENDAEGATYEAHMTKSDGSVVTVKLDASFKVTSIENGMR